MGVADMPIPLMMIRRMRTAIVAAGAVALLAVSAVVVAAPVQQIDGPSDVVAPAERGESYTIRTKPLHITMISDSALAAIRWFGATGLLDSALMWDTRLESCRRIQFPSCRGREGYRPLTLVEEVDAILADGAVPDGSVLLISVGHNDWESRFRSDLEHTLARARAAGFERVGWINYREEVDYVLPGSSDRTDYAAMNDILDAVDRSGQWPELVVLDYDAFTAGRTDWFTDDGVHLTPHGTFAVINWLNSIIQYSVTSDFAPDTWQAD